MTDHFVISGITGAGAPNRREINDLVKDERQFSLYIQALQRMYDDSQDNTLSYFQVGGIHGLPFIPWDNSTGSQPFNPNAQWGGYCTHGSTLFPTWHRPYVMLVEQILHKHATDIAATYTVNQDAWKKSAADFRHPYWDWASKAVPPPEVISLAQVTITTPNGRRTAVNNPLVRYRFHPIHSSFRAPYNAWQTTLRQPNSTSRTATDNVARLRAVLSSAQSDITTGTFNMLTRVNTWAAFSSHTVGDGGSSSNSIEAIHDDLHVYVGGSGHMSNPAVAAFDPIFFLHHCNVDRLLSLWSALHPGVWVSKGDSEDGSFTMRAEIPVDVTTPLTPFWNAQTSFWASGQVGDTTKLGYTYPEFNGLDMGNTSAVQQAISLIVRRLYSAPTLGVFAAMQPASFAAIPESAKPTPLATSVDAGGEEDKLPGASARSINPPSNENDQFPLASFVQTPSAPEAELWEWTARIQFKKYELGGSFSVLLFLGTVPEDPEDWLVSPNFIGAHNAFVNTYAGQCENCRTQSELVNEGFVHLNGGIAQHSGLGSFSPDVVHPYLKDQLKWKVQKTDGEVAELESLEVSVVATPLSLPPGAIFPVPGAPQKHNGITHGQPGGCRHA
ncbi:tyrosinase [Crucibulum laeve]|uniref:tyrosinase n=1 Tax=Crucibulum laeve TaxID=68775 RepID=A0A5C3M099_9AGAR|nr:tyrosinase [Crucibulum laeve]